MSKYRFKTEEEFKKDKLWDDKNGCPLGWVSTGSMDKYLGEDIPKKYNEKCKRAFHLSIMDHVGCYWDFSADDYVEKKETENWSEWAPSNEINPNGFEYFGDTLMEVSANNNWWFPRVVFGKKGGSYLAWSDAKTLEEAKNAYNSSWWKYTRPIKTKLTLKQVADKFGLDVNEIEIVDCEE